MQSVLDALGSTEPWLIAACVAALLAGGLVKGTIGIGLPLVAAPVLATALSVPQAIALLSVPVLAANLWQSVQGRHYGAVVKRFWPLMIGLALGVALSTRALVTVPGRYLFLILGVIVIAYPVTLFLRFEWRVTPRTERWAGPFAGLATGAIAGFSYFFGPPLAIYFSTLRLSKDVFVASIALLGVYASVLISASLAHYDLLGGKDLLLSCIAAVPVLIGVVLGTALRARINEQIFRNFVIFALLLTGLNLVRKALF